MVRSITLLAVLSVAGMAPAAEPKAAAPKVAAPKVAERWAVLVGVDDYAYAQKLQYCGADQVALSKQLVAAGFPAEQVFLLHDKAENPRFRPSLGNIDRQLNLVLNLADADDLVVIAFSGHGVHIAGKSYLCPAECSLDDPATLIAVDGIYDRLKECAANFKLVLVDACRNDPRPGGGRSMTATEGTRALARTLQELKVPEGVVLLNSCAPGEVSWEDAEFGHGVFMHYVLDGLAGEADTGGDGSVSLHELQAYAGQRTKTYVANRHSVAQRPFFKGDLTTEALEYALLPVPGGAKGKLDRFDKTKPADIGIWIGNKELPPRIWEMNHGWPADRAGVQKDDVILSVGGKKTVNYGEVAAAVTSQQPGATIELVVRRGDRQVTLQVVAEAESSPRFISWLKSSSEAGNTASMVRLGRIYVTDTRAEAPKDEAEGLLWIRRAADAGDALGMYYLADMYSQGVGVAKDDAEAIRLWERARSATGPLARDGAYGQAAAALGDMYYNGQGVAKGLARAAQLYREASAVGHPKATWRLGQKYEGGEGVPQDYGQALELYEKSAAAHLAEAEFSLGYAFNNAIGVARDPQTARSWYERAVEHGDIDARVCLGSLLKEGEGGPRDVVRAAALYRHAADAGNNYGLYNLAALYQEGTGVPRDYAKAMELYKAAADQGFGQGEFGVGVMYDFGYGVPADPSTARMWYEKAAKNGISAAAYNLGNCYHRGEGVAQDYPKAMEYFQQAAKLGHAGAENSIGTMIYNGQGVQRDLVVARGWYEAAAAHGSRTGMYNLGTLYESGEGGRKNLLKAAEWYRKAADLGQEDAKKKLDEL